MFKHFYRLMEGNPDGTGSGGADVTYNFGDGVSQEQATVLTEHAKTLGLTADQAPKYAAHYAQLQAANAPPESYTFAQVEGKDLAPELATELSATAKQLGLNQTQAQAFAAYELKLRTDADKETAAGLQKVQQGWKDTISADKDLGGAGLEANRATAKTALEKFFPEVAKNQAGFPFLDHPEVFRGLVTIGKAIGPDGDFVRNPGGNTGAADPAKVMFPGMA